MRILNKISIIGVLLSAVFYLGACGGSSSTTTAVNPTGSGSVTLDPVTKKLSGSFTVMNMTGTTAAHIHDGAVGVAGGVVVGLTESTPGTWSVPATAIALTDAQIARLQAGANYVNVHTVLNPGGEIRGQLMPDSANPNKFNATLDLAQEVPTPKTPLVTTSGY
ncbi:MAG TPA: CHRD domain-containing protein [Dongiaceae bacterium]|nr:CHRD domain-containing protein [Dongiaceae bacterium]